MKSLLILFVVIAHFSEGFAQNDRIGVSVVDLKSDDGKVICALFRSSDRQKFPAGESAYKTEKVSINATKAFCEFSSVGDGEFAVSVMHDENDNSKMDTNWIGIPNEGYGTSNDAKGTLGPPSYEDAKFTKGGDTHEITVKMRY